MRNSPSLSLPWTSSSSPASNTDWSSCLIDSLISAWTPICTHKHIPLLVFFSMCISVYRSFPWRSMDTFSDDATALPGAITHSTISVWTFLHPCLPSGNSISTNCDVHTWGRDYPEKFQSFSYSSGQHTWQNHRGIH